MENKQISNLVKNNLIYAKRIQTIMDSHQTKVSSGNTRRNYIQKQKQMNYQNEYDRIRGLMNTNITKYGVDSVSGLKAREKQLLSLGAKIIDQIA